MYPVEGHGDQVVGVIAASDLQAARGAAGESKMGVEVSKADVSTSLFLFDPDYGENEFGLDAQVLVVGGAVGIDPAELLDFFGGFVLADPRRDDILYRGPDEERPRRRERSVLEGSGSIGDGPLTTLAHHIDLD